jgi:hypothetical protein
MFGDRETWLARPSDKKFDGLVIVVGEVSDPNFNLVEHQRMLRAKWDSKTELLTLATNDMVVPPILRNSCRTLREISVSRTIRTQYSPPV